MCTDLVEREFQLGLQWSTALHDEMAWAAFATYGTQRILALSPKFALQLLEESEGKSKAWAELAPEYAALHVIAEGALSGLRRTVVVDG
jgi:3-methyladenine DNA glycosylase Tag